MSQRKSTRREFGKAIALTAATPLAALADEPKTPAKPPDRVPAAADALAAVVRDRYGEYLSEEQLKGIRRSIERHLRMADQLKKIPLHNGDEPAFVFRADVP